MEPVRISLVDDRVSLNGWRDALHALLPSECVSVRTDHEGVLTDSAGEVLILDLMLPTWAEASEALLNIRSCCPALPILILGHADNSLAALRGLQTGGDAFLARTLPYARALEDCIDFAEEFVAHLSILKLFSRSRYSSHADLVARLPHSWPWPSSGRDFRHYKRDVDLLKRQIRDNDIHATVPPSPEELSSFLKRHLKLVLYLWWRAMCLWIQVSGQRLSGDTRQRIYKLRTLNDGGFDEINRGQLSVAPLVRLAAIMSGALVEELAIWNRSLLDKTPVDRRMWGSTLSGSFNIRDEIAELGAGERAWTLRVEALGKRASTRAWDISLFPQILDAVEASIHRFVENRTRGAQTDSPVRPRPV